MPLRKVESLAELLADSPGRLQVVFSAGSFGKHLTPRKEFVNHISVEYFVSRCRLCTPFRRIGTTNATSAGQRASDQVWAPP